MARKRLDVIPARVRVPVVRRLKYACRICDGQIAQAPTPERLVESGLTFAYITAAPDRAVA